MYTTTPFPKTATSQYGRSLDGQHFVDTYGEKCARGVLTRLFAITVFAVRNDDELHGDVLAHARRHSQKRQDLCLRRGGVSLHV